MKLWTQPLLAVGLVTAVALAGEEPAGKMTDPVEILKKVDTAAKEVKAVCHSTTFAPMGAAVGRQPEIKGKGCYSGFSGMLPELFQFEFEAKSTGDQPTRSFIMGTDGEEFYLVDHQEKKAYVDLDPQVVGRAGQMGRGVAMIEFVHNAPFSDEINAKSHKLLGIEKVGDEPCYKIEVEYNNAAQTAVWYFSVNDLLPRRVDRTMRQGEGPVFGTSQVVTNLKILKSLDADKFKLKLPAGYEKTDDFAP